MLPVVAVSVYPKPVTGSSVLSHKLWWNAFHEPFNHDCGHCQLKPTSKHPELMLLVPTTSCKLIGQGKV